jgi:hypothetical protein
VSIRERVSAAISKMDSNLSETDPAWGHAAFLIASFILGPDPQAIADAMEFDPISIGVWAERARSNGIWKDGKSSVENYTDEDDGIKFWLDCSIIGGSLKKVGDDKYQMTDFGKAEAQKLVRTPRGKFLINKLKGARK